MKELYEENYKVLLKDAKDLKREACHEPRKGKPRIKKKINSCPYIITIRVHSSIHLEDKMHNNGNIRKTTSRNILKHW